MNGLKSNRLTVYDYHDMVKYTEAKHGFDERNYHHKWYGCKGYKEFHEARCQHKDAWERANYPELDKYKTPPLVDEYPWNGAGLAYAKSYEGGRRLTNIHSEYQMAPDGECEAPQYMDYWHSLLEKYFNNHVFNGVITTINWKTALDWMTEDWEKQCGEYFVRDWGDRTHNVRIAW